MKKLSIILLSVSIVTNISFAIADTEKIIATYKGGTVKESQITQQLQHMFANKKFSDFDSKVQEQLIHVYINSKLLLQEAKKLKISSSKKLQDELKQLEDQLIQRECINHYLKSHVTTKMIDDEYNKLVTNLKGKEEIKVSHILVTTKKEADNIKKRLSKGEKFTKLAQELSKDEGTKSNGGEIGYIIPGQVVSEIGDRASLMKVNEISTPIQTKFGWHIITILDKRPAIIPSKEEATNNIASTLSATVLEKYFAELASKADIKIMLSKSSEKDKADKKAETTK